jgi:hypothetical protein
VHSSKWYAEERENIFTRRSEWLIAATVWRFEFGALKEMILRNISK